MTPDAALILYALVLDKLGRIRAAYPEHVQAPAEVNFYNARVSSLVYIPARNNTGEDAMKVNPIPEGFRTITPYFSVVNAGKFIEFLKQAFDARDTYIIKMPDGTVMSSEIKIGDSIVMVGEHDADQAAEKPMRDRARFYMYVEDADAVFKKAIQAGATSIAEPDDQIWGDRSGVVEDMAGNEWWIATHKEDIPAEELVRRAMGGEKD